MAFWDKFTPSKTPATQRTFRECSPEEQNEILDLLSGGTAVATIAREYNVSSPSLYLVKNKTQEPVTSSTPMRAARPPVDPEVERIQSEIARLKAESELEKVKGDIEYQRELQRLTLEEKRLDIQARRAELYDDDDDDEDFDIETVADDPSKAMWEFFALLLKKQLAGKVSSPTDTMPAVSEVVQAPRPPPPDMANEQSYDAIKLEMEIRFTPEQLAQAAKVPKAMLHPQIKQQFPNITENNLKHIDQVLATYGQ